MGRLSGRWTSDDYDYYTLDDPTMRKAEEIVDIWHEGDRIRATKVTGDPCVPAGFVTFEGTLPQNGEIAAVTWTTGHPHAPASERVHGFVRIVDSSHLEGGCEHWTMTFRRQGGSENGGEPSRFSYRQGDGHQRDPRPGDKMTGR